MFVFSWEYEDERILSFKGNWKLQEVNQFKYFSEIYSKESFIKEYFWLPKIQMAEKTGQVLLSRVSFYVKEEPSYYNKDLFCTQKGLNYINRKTRFIKSKKNAFAATRKSFWLTLRFNLSVLCDFSLNTDTVKKLGYRNKPIVKVLQRASSYNHYLTGGYFFIIVFKENHKTRVDMVSVSQFHQSIPKLILNFVKGQAKAKSLFFADRLNNIKTLYN